MLDINKIFFESYKCFKTRNCIEIGKPINIIIGKNNIGKSSLLDIIEFINDSIKLYENQAARIYIEKNVDENAISRTFSKSTSSGKIPTRNDYEFGETFIDKPFIFRLKSIKSTYGNNIDFKKELSIELLDNQIYEEKYNEYWMRLADNLAYITKKVKRIYAERNVEPEELKSQIFANGNGEGITNIINSYLNTAKYNEDKVKNELLNKLNEIMGKDAHFMEIDTQQIEGNDGINRWEIFLKEKEKGRIALSKSGSGLKTILMILVFTILIPDFESTNLENYIFLFEEIENNLHPSIIRRVMKYIEEITDQGATVFLTTHSNVLLDSFQNNENVQAFHVIKEENSVNVKRLDNIIGKKNCLMDIGIKASDILQANGVIWVEGPSDRIYINKWIELWSGGAYKEGMNYQCVFYGGRLLSNTTFNDENTEDMVNLMTVNRNSIVLIDSDKTSPAKHINETKKRIKDEFNKNGELCWITAGKEIENYIPMTFMKKIYPQLTENIGKYEKIDAYLDKYKKGSGEDFKRNKIKYAHSFSEDMTLEKMKEVLDIDKMMKRVISEIKRWNEL